MTALVRTRQLLDMAKLAEEAGLDIIGVGEHQTLRYVNSATATTGRDPADVRIAAFGHLHVTETSCQTREAFFPYYSKYLEPLFRGRMPRRSFEQMVGPGGSLVGGSVDEVVDELVSLRDVICLTRFVGQIDIGGQPFHTVAQGIELLATRVAPQLAKNDPNPGTTVLPPAG